MDMVKIVASIVLQATAAATIVKILVDILKISRIPSPSRLLPVAALVLGIVVAIGLDYAAGSVLVGRSFVLNVFVGLVAGSIAIGVTQLHNESNKDKPVDELDSHVE